MNYSRQRFSGDRHAEFLDVLRNRVNEYLENQGVTRYANSNMVLKTIFMFLLYFTPYALMCFGIGNDWPIMMGMWAVMGLGMAGIGLNIMHDANHGAYSSNVKLNKIMGLSMNVVGANAEMWKIQHNVLHHTYTNIHGADEDIDTPVFLRFSPHDKRLWIHRFQFIYVWFFYGISTLFWVTVKEFAQLVRYRKMGLIKGKNKYQKLMTQLVGWKLYYFIFILVIPLLFFPVPAWQILLSFTVMHFVCGLILSAIFQLAHVMPECEYPMPDEKGKHENSWAAHELMTTANFAPRSRVLSWLIGGLNFQIEHHLFANICHVHYKRISETVATTAKEFGLPYNVQRTFFSAIVNHIKMLYTLGRLETAPASRR